MDISYNPFYVNQRLELAPRDAILYLSSRIEDFQGENLVVAMPMRNSVPVYLTVGSPVYGKALTTEGGIYSFDSSLLEYSMQPIPLWVIKKPSNINQIQQRNFFRYDINIPVRYFIVDENGFPIEDTETVFMTRNLSGGGLLLVSPKTRLPMGTKLWLEIPLSSDEIIRTMAVVTRINSKKNDDGRRFFLIGLRFIDMEEITIRRVINFLNKKVLEQRNKGIL